MFDHFGALCNKRLILEARFAIIYWHDYWQLFHGYFLEILQNLDKLLLLNRPLEVYFCLTSCANLGSKYFMKLKFLLMEMIQSFKVFSKNTKNNILELLQTSTEPQWTFLPKTKLYQWLIIEHFSKSVFLSTFIYILVNIYINLLSISIHLYNLYLCFLTT